MSPKLGGADGRYYGKSVPVKSFSTDDLRFLNNAESLEDSAYVRASCRWALTTVHQELQASQEPYGERGRSQAEEHAMDLLWRLVRWRACSVHAQGVS